MVAPLFPPASGGIKGGSAENYDRLAQLLDTKYFREEAIVASRKAVELTPNEYRYREALARRLMEKQGLRRGRWLNIQKPQSWHRTPSS